MLARARAARPPRRGGPATSSLAARRYDPRSTHDIALRNNGSPLKEDWIAGLVLLCLGGIVFLVSPFLIEYATTQEPGPSAFARPKPPSAGARVIPGADSRQSSRPAYERSPSGDHMYVNNA